MSDFNKNIPNTASAKRVALKPLSSTKKVQITLCKSLTLSGVAYAY